MDGIELDFGFVQPSGSPYGLVGRPVKLFEAYQDWNANSDQAETLREAAHTTSDFATYLSGVVRKRFYDAYKAKTTNWRRYANIVSVPDFRTETLVGLDEFSDLLEVVEEDEYKYGTLGETTGPTIQLRTFGRLLQMSRKLLINDDLGRLSRSPAAMARAAARTLENDVLAILTGNPTAYDGDPFFDVAHSNTGTTALAEASLQTAVLAVLAQTNQNGDPLDIDIDSLELVVPTGLMFTAKRILQSTNVGTTGTNGLGEKNVMENVVKLHVESKLADQTDWYLFGKITDSDAAPVVVAFLNGKANPDVMQKTTVQQLGSGAFDPYNLEVDNIDWKVRHDWGTTPGEWRLAYKGIVAG